MDDPICGDVLDQDGWIGRCGLDPDHELPHAGMCGNPDRSEIASLLWSPAPDE